MITRQRIWILKERIRKAETAAAVKAAATALRQAEKERAKQLRSVKAVEERIKTRNAKLAYVREERARHREIEAALRAGQSKERLLQKHFYARDSFRHSVLTMAEAKPDCIYRFHPGLQSWVKLSQSVLRLGAPVEFDLRRQSRHMRDCQVWQNDAWQTIKIRGIDGADAIQPIRPEPVAPAAPVVPVVEQAEPTIEDGPIMFGPRTTYEQLMSGRILVETLHERAPNEYLNQYTVEKLDDCGDRFFVHYFGTWHLIPGQPEPRARKKKFSEMTDQELMDYDPSKE